MIDLKHTVSQEYTDGLDSIVLSDKKVLKVRYGHGEDGDSMESVTE